MTRIKRGYVARRRRKKILTIAAGSKRARSKLIRTANQQAMKAMVASTQNRRRFKRDMRSLWIIRINAAARKYGITYNRLLTFFATINLKINRKLLAQIATLDAKTFDFLYSRIRES